MKQIGFRLPDDLADKFDLYAASRGGRSATLRALIEAALPDTEITPAAPRLDTGNWQGIVVRLEPRDFPRLDEEAKAMGMSRAQWLLACVRKRLHQRRLMSALDRTWISRTEKEMRRVAFQVGRAASGVRSAAEQGRAVDAPLEILQGLMRRAELLADSIREGFRGNDAYWEGGTAAEATRTADTKT